LRSRDAGEVTVRSRGSGYRGGTIAGTKDAMTERKPAGMSFETWVDQQITQAQARGAFEGLTLAGRPLPRRDREQTSYEWALEWARRENGGADGMLPPGLAMRMLRLGVPVVVGRLAWVAAVGALGE
jgi:hypothetical protein